jgi:glycosyltransferase involved in cell wall biosynthesis
VLYLIAFWVSVAFLVYGYAGFPLLVGVVGRIRNRRVLKAPVTPTVSLIIAAYNEEEGIRQRIENALQMDYPADRLDVIVASDGSTDGTEAALSDLDPGKVRVLSLPRRGKARALEAAVPQSRGEVLVFSDANTLFEPGALRALVRNFADPEVGGVAGHTGYVVPQNGESAGRGEDLYWRYDSWLKGLETRTGSVISAHGGMYALRRELFRPLEDLAVTDDFGISTAVVEQGWRLVFEPEARGYERTVGQSAGEFSRRVRLMTRGLRGVVLRRRLLNPARYGFYSVSFFSHKVLRRTLPLFLPVLLVSSVALAPQGTLYMTAAGAQGMFYSLALAGWALRNRRGGRLKPLYIPFFFCLANLAAVVALWNLVRGKRIERWSPQRHGSHPRTNGGPAKVPSSNAGGPAVSFANPSPPDTAPPTRLPKPDVPCCVLQRPDKTGFLGLETIQVLVEPENASALKERLLAKGFLTVPTGNGRVHTRMVGPTPGGSGWICVEALTELRYGRPMALFGTSESTGALIRRSRCDASVSVLSPDAEFVDLLLHGLLDRGQFSPALTHHLQALMRALRDRPSLAGRAAERVQFQLAPAITWDGLVRDVTAGDWDRLLRRRRSLALRLGRAAPLRTLARLVERPGKLVFDLARTPGRARRPGLVVALVSRDRGRETMVVQGLGRVAGSWARALEIRWRRSRGHTVIVKRSALQGGAKGPGMDARRPGWGRRLLEGPIPPADMVVVLDAPGSVGNPGNGKHQSGLSEGERPRHRWLA